jgi:hypothetical protein
LRQKEKVVSQQIAANLEAKKAAQIKEIETVQARNAQENRAASERENQSFIRECVELAVPPSWLRQASSKEVEQLKEARKCGTNPFIKRD